MKKIVSALMSMSVLFGCASHQDFEPKSGVDKQITSIQQIEWNEVAIPSSFSVHFSNNAQHLESTLFSGPVAGFSFEATEPRLTIEVSGIVKGLQVFAPNLALFDQNFDLLRSYSSSYFDYDSDDFIKGDVLFGGIELNLPMNIKRIYGVIYTTDEDLIGTTELLHPAKAMAIAKRTVPPAIDNPVAEHVEFGEVRVAIKRESTLFGLNTSEKNASALEVPIQYSGSTSIKNMQQENQSYYHKAIKSAVENNDIPKALSLLDEAKALKIKGAQEVFVKAINRN